MVPSIPGVMMQPKWKEQDYGSLAVAVCSQGFRGSRERKSPRQMPQEKNKHTPSSIVAHLQPQLNRQVSILRKQVTTVVDFFANYKLIQRVAPKSYQQGFGEVYVTSKFLENFSGDKYYAAPARVRFLERSFGVPRNHLGQQSHGFCWPYGPVYIVMEQMLRLLHDCGMPLDDVDFINSDGKTINQSSLPRNHRFRAKMLLDTLRRDVVGVEVDNSNDGATGASRISQSNEENVVDLQLAFWNDVDKKHVGSEMFDKKWTKRDQKIDLGENLTIYSKNIVGDEVKNIGDWLSWPTYVEGEASKGWFLQMTDPLDKIDKVFNQLMHIEFVPM
ncbi:hypothetical protein CTI12_AA093640 [Artemisia annua]|uniref:Uncharacterized protein n=1 Tax=Artemisia annua TaxID=35608 RepID=A0A2U1PT95_ARTAN|nr:hypothetical protein CTI12_AA093640 [Artemisia annua]